MRLFDWSIRESRTCSVLPHCSPVRPSFKGQFTTKAHTWCCRTRPSSSAIASRDSSRFFLGIDSDVRADASAKFSGCSVTAIPIRSFVTLRAITTPIDRLQSKIPATFDGETNALLSFVAIIFTWVLRCLSYVLILIVFPLQMLLLLTSSCFMFVSSGTVLCSVSCIGPCLLRAFSCFGSGDSQRNNPKAFWNVTQCPTPRVEWKRAIDFNLLPLGLGTSQR